MLTPADTRRIATYARPPGARTLYLAHGVRKRASVSDQSLVLTTVLAQQQRFPLQRVVRIVSSTTVDWSGAALQACQQACIAITWIDAQGTALGTLCPHHRQSSDFGTALDVLLEQPEGLQRYRHWEKARRLSVLRQWRAACTSPPQPQAWEELKRDWVYQGHIKVCLPAEMHAQCLALVAQQLAAAQLPFECYGPEAHPIALDHDLCNLLWGAMNLGCASLMVAAQDQATRIALFERWQQCNAAALLVHLQSLNQLAHRALRPGLWV